MGCLKLSYEQDREGLEQSTVFFRGDQAKKGRQRKNREDYYPFGLTFNTFSRVGLDKNEYLYQGKEEMEGTDFYDFHARSYHAGLGRFMSVDPLYNGPSPFVGMNNNPISTIDPDGEEPITIITAIAIGATVSAASYTASVALSDGGFNNWDWGQFGKQVAIGAVSGAVTAGIGTAFQTTYGAQLTFGQQVLKSAVHAHVQGTISEFTGGDYLTGAASGFVGGVVSGRAGAWTQGWSKAGQYSTQIGSAMLMGGTVAELQQEGEFWRGAAVAGIVAGANDVAHKVGENLTQKIRFNKFMRELQENGGFRQVTGMVLLNGNNQAAFTYNVNDGSGRYVVQEGGVSIAYDYDPNTEAKTNPQILSKPLDLSRFDRTSGTRYPNFLVETFKWSDLQGAFGKYTHQVWDGFVNGQGQVWELPSTYGVRNGALYDITTYRFITSINFRGSNFTFKIDVEDYTPR